MNVKECTKFWGLAHWNFVRDEHNHNLQNLGVHTSKDALYDETATLCAEYMYNFHVSPCFMDICFSI